MQSIYASEGVASWEFGPDSHHLAVGLASGRIEVWDLNQRRAVLRLSQSTGPVNVLTFSRDGTRIAAGTGDGRLWRGEASIWDFPSGKKITTLLQSDCVRDLAFSLDGARLVTIAYAPRLTCTIKIWDAATGEELLTLSDASPTVGRTAACLSQPVAALYEVPIRVTFSFDGNSLLAVHGDGTLSTWKAPPSSRVPQ